MQSGKKSISPLLYYILISSLTNITFILVGAAAITLLYMKTINEMVIIFVAVFIFWKGIIIGFVVWISQNTLHNKEFALKFIGNYHGRFSGLFIGGILGEKTARILTQSNIFGFIAGALVLYFIGSWIGSKVSHLIGGQIDKILSMDEYNVQKKVFEKSASNLRFIKLCIVFLPWMFVIIALGFIYLHINNRKFLVEWLPITRIIVISLIIFLMCVLWTLRKYWLKIRKSSESLPKIDFLLIGLSLSVVPVIFGMVLFFGMGASIIELCFFAMASSISAIIWIRYNRTPEE
jgi:hypothetical protein